MQSSRRETAGTLLLLFIVSLPAWAPLTRPGLPRWRPGALPVFRLYALERGEDFAAAGMLDSGFAYAVARLLRLPGLDGVTALKVSLILGMILLGLVMWLGVRRMWGPRAGALAVILALYAPVFLSALYILGGIALPWLLLGLSLIGWGWTLRGWSRWVVMAAGAGLAALNASFLFHPSLLPTSPSFYQLIEPSWFWGTNTVGLETGPAWALGLPLLALALMALWLAFASPPRGATLPLRMFAPIAFLLLLAAPFTPAQASLALILTASLMLAAVAASLLALAPTLKTPAVWAAWLMLPLLAAGPALSPEFQTYPIPERPAAVFGATQILLVDVSATAPPAPGQSLTVNAFWQATQPIDFDYNLFIHVTDDAGNIVAQFDGQPGGDRPMTAWMPGEVLSARYEVAIPAEAPASLHVRLGLYNWQTGARLPLASGGDALILGQ